MDFETMLSDMVCERATLKLVITNATRKDVTLIVSPHRQRLRCAMLHSAPKTPSTMPRRERLKTILFLQLCGTGVPGQPSRLFRAAGFGDALVIRKRRKKNGRRRAGHALIDAFVLGCREFIMQVQSRRIAA